MMCLTAAQQEMVEENLSLVTGLINKYYGFQRTDIDDLTSIGYIGLCKAASTFDPGFNVKFSTYASRCILNAVRNELRRAFVERRGNGQVPFSLNTPLWLDDGLTEHIEQVEDVSENTERDALDPVFLASIKKIAPTIVEMVIGDMSMPDMARKYSVTRQAIHNRVNRERERLRKSKALSL